MPYIHRKEAPFEPMKRLLRGYFNGTELSDVLGCSPNTARSRVKSPETLTLGELKMICQRGHIAKDELMEAIKW